MELLKGKVALVTGGSRGIGRSIVMDLAVSGADVAFTYRQDVKKAQDKILNAGLPPTLAERLSIGR